MCTCIMLKNKTTLFGRNMDNYFSFNEQIIIVPKNYNITFKNETNIESHYAIIGMGTIIDNYPLLADGANEKGLAIAALSFKDNAIYYKKEKDKINLAPYEMMLYLLATCKNIKEVKSVLKRINIINEPFKKDVLLTDLHFMISDLSESIVLETTCEGMKIYDNPVNVLTNNPIFPYHLENLKNYMHLNVNDSFNFLYPSIELKPNSFGQGSFGIPGDYSSSSRFIKAVFVKENLLLSNDINDTINQFFKCLDSVSMVKGVVNTIYGFEYTRYTCCIDLNSLNYYYKTYENSEVNIINLFNEDLNSKKLIAYKI